MGRDKNTHLHKTNFRVSPTVCEKTSI